MMQRENQTDWLADLIEEQQQKIGKDRLIKILGKSFKPETNITTGSPSILLKNILEERGHQVEMFDPYIDGSETKIGWRGQKLGLQNNEPQVYFIGTKHPDFTFYEYNQGSIIIDPWRYIPNQEGCEVIHIGDNLNETH
jgi:UDPglucose 6-dehydrogenase